VRMLGSGRPFVLEIINARAAVPPQSAFDAMQLTLEKVTSDAASLVLDMQPCMRLLTSLHDAECYMTGLITDRRYSELCHCITAALLLFGWMVQQVASLLSHQDKTKNDTGIQCRLL